MMTQRLANQPKGCGAKPRNYGAETATFFRAMSAGLQSANCRKRQDAKPQGAKANANGHARLHWDGTVPITTLCQPGRRILCIRAIPQRKEDTP